MKTSKQRELLVLLLCLLIGFALRFYTFDQKSLWIDEVYTFNAFLGPQLPGKEGD